MRPQRANIAAPELPERLRWHRTEKPPRMTELCAAGPVLVHFFDFAQLNSVRALPYVNAWQQRYREAGLTTLGVHSPRFAFSARPELLAPALERLQVRHAVADDSRYGVWHDYGCRGWPSLFLWGLGGALRWVHFGEGEYAATEAAIVEELRTLDSTIEAPAFEPLRPSDAPDALVAPPSAEVFPGGSAAEPWRAVDGEWTLELTYEAAGAHASVDGEGELRVALDGGDERVVRVDEPGLHDLAQHPQHERHALMLGASEALTIYSVSYSAGVP